MTNAVLEKEEKQGCQSVYALEHSDDVQETSSLAKALRSSFVVGLLLFLFLSAWAQMERLGSSNPKDFPYLGWSGWAIKDFFAQKEHPNVVFLGSSLMLVPISGTDSNFLNKRIDGAKHHRSIFFENAFEKYSGKDIRTFNFSLPGEMPSDAYMIVDFLLKGRMRPDVIVYGVGPRDFVDNMLASPSTTDPYRYFSRFGDVGAVVDRMMPTINERFSYEFGKVLYLFSVREDLAEYFSRSVRPYIDKALPLAKGVEAYNFDQRRALLPEYRPTELHQGEAFFRPQAKSDTSHLYDNLEEYRKRYKSLKWETFLAQMTFLADSMKIASLRDTHVVIVAMPITDINRSILQKDAYSAYKQSLRLLCAAKGATFIDFDQGGNFKEADFLDTVHLHAHGGQKMLDLLAQEIAKDPKTMNALAKSMEAHADAQAAYERALAKQKANL